MECKPFLQTNDAEAFPQFSPDGRRFLMIQTVESETNLGPIGVITNWFDELRRLVPSE